MATDGVLGAFEETVLLCVAHGAGEAYGMSVRREIETRCGRSVAIGAVYATLDRLEVKGLVRSSTDVGSQARGGSARRTFQLLPDGAAALVESRRQRDSLWDGLDPSTLHDLPERQS